MIMFESNKTSLVISGVVAILIGAVALAWPTLTMSLLALLIGAFLLIEGIIALVLQTQKLYSVTGAVEAALGIVIAILILFFPEAAVRAIVVIAALGLILRGALHAWVAVGNRSRRDALVFLVGTAVLSLVAGLLLLLRPEAGVVALSWLIGFFAILSGTSLLIWATRLP